MFFVRLVAGAATTLVFMSGLSAQQRSGDPASSLPAVLQTAATYLDGFERDIQAVVAEEDYTQRFVAAPAGFASGLIPSGYRERKLKSVLLVLGDQRFGTVTFRDVYEVDGKPVRDRDERLASLFIKPSANASQTAKAISEESARFNLNVSGVSTNRTINVPMAALLYLRGPFQQRSNFTLVEVVTVRGRRAAVIEFHEQALPRLISSPNNLPMEGRAWIELGTGRILETELRYELTGRAGRTNAKIAVVYAEDRTTRMFLPTTMQETLGASQGGALSTRAEYSKFRRFSVDAETAFTVNTPAAQ